MLLIEKSNGNHPRTDEQKQQMIKEAAIHYGHFLTALGFDWNADPHSRDTPRRVAKAWVNDLIAGCVNEAPKITNFPNDEQYSGLVCQTNIPVKSMCAHHNLPFVGVAHVAYLPGYKDANARVVGLSKLNRIVDFFARRPTVQESLTKQIADFVDEQCVGNRGVAVIIESQHQCVSCRGIKNDSTMVTSQLTKYFFSDVVGTRTELFNLINHNRK